MEENQLRKIVSEITDDYVETIMDAILEDDVKGLPITKAVWHFMCELKKNNIVMELNDVDTLIFIQDKRKEPTNNEKTLMFTPRTFPLRSHNPH